MLIAGDIGGTKTCGLKNSVPEPRSVKSGIVHSAECLLPTEGSYECAGR